MWVNAIPVMLAPLIQMYTASIIKKAVAKFKGVIFIYNRVLQLKPILEEETGADTGRRSCMAGSWIDFNSQTPDPYQPMFD